MLASSSGKVKKSRSSHVADRVHDEGAEQVHPALALAHRGGGLLPGPAQRVGLVVGQQRAPLLEHGLDLVAVPGLVPGHQAHVEVEAVEAHVEDVEGAHRRPPVLVAEGERRDALALHVVHERHEVVVVGRRLPAVLVEDGLAVEDRPRVVAHRHEVLLAVRRGRGLLEGVVEAVDGPLVAEVGDQAVLGELGHPEAGEPGEHVVRRALEVGVDALLERVVVDGVDRDLGVGLLAVRVGHGLEPVVGGTGALRLVDAEASRSPLDRCRPSRRRRTRRAGWPPPTARPLRARPRSTERREAAMVVSADRGMALGRDSDTTASWRQNQTGKHSM